MVDKPKRKMFVPFSFGVIEVSEWEDGHKSACLRLDRSYRTAPSADADEDMKKRYQEFIEYGHVTLRPSDALNLMDVGYQLRPDLTYQCGGRQRS